MIESVQDYAIYMLDREATSRAGTPPRSGSSNMRRPKSLESLGRSTSTTIAKQACRSVRCGRRARSKYEAEGWRVRRDGTRFWRRRHRSDHDDKAALSASPRSPRHQPSAGTHRSGWKAAREQLMQRKDGGVGQ